MHQNDQPPVPGGPVPASGWIKELATRQDGIWGRVEWASRAAGMIAEKAYRFLSPVILFDAPRPAPPDGTPFAPDPNRASRECLIRQLMQQAAATDAERAAVEQLLATIERQRVAKEQSAALREDEHIGIALNQHHVGGHRADHEPKHAPGVISYAIRLIASRSPGSGRPRRCALINRIAYQTKARCPKATVQD